MFRKIVVVAAVAAAAVLSCPAAAQPSAPAAPEDFRITAAQVAEAATPQLPQNFGPDGTLTRAVAEGTLLVLTYEVTAAVAASVPAEELARRHAAPFCASDLGAPFFGSGNSLRIDIAVTGGSRPPRSTPVITSCAGR